VFNLVVTSYVVVTAFLFGIWLTLVAYEHCFSVNDTALACYNFDVRQPISIMKCC